MRIEPRVMNPIIRPVTNSLDTIGYINQYTSNNYTETNVSTSDFFIRKVKGDGDCYFRAIEVSVRGNDTNYL